MRWLLRFLRPINFHRSDYKFYDTLAKNELNSRNLLEIEYGEYPVKAEDLGEVNERPVSVRSHYQDKQTGLFGKALYSVAALGYVHGKPTLIGGSAKQDESQDNDAETEHDRSIYLNHVMYSPVGQGGLLFLTSLLAKAAVTATVALQPWNFFLDRAYFLIAMPLSSLRFSHITQLLTLPFRPAMDTIGHEHVHVLQVHDKFERGTGFNAMADHFKQASMAKWNKWDSTRALANSFCSLNTVSYYMNDCEVQARLHTLLAKGFKRWGRLPETRHEFFAAMIDGGLTAPDFIHDEVSNSAEEGVKDFLKPSLSSAFNRHARGFTRTETAELNVAYRGQLRKDLKAEHWRNTLPYLYGHLLELYGDNKGRLKMGYTGPVTMEDGPMPLDKEQRQAFLSKLDRWEAEEMKTEEFARGIYIEDEGFNLPEYYARHAGEPVTPRLEPHKRREDLSKDAVWERWIDSWVEERNQAHPFQP